MAKADVPSENTYVFAVFHLVSVPNLNVPEQIVILLLRTVSVANRSYINICTSNLTKVIFGLYWKQPAIP